MNNYNFKFTKSSYRNKEGLFILPSRYTMTTTN